MKALVAASQCPHCGHLLDLRDSFGELLPLAHCSSCNSDYPLRDGGCKWCGTTPEPRQIGPIAWKAAGVIAFAGMALGVYLTREPSEQVSNGAVLVQVPQADSATEVRPVIVPVVVETIPAPTPSKAVDSAPAPVTVSAAKPDTAIAPPVVAVARPAPPATVESAPREVPRAHAPARPVVRSSRVRWSRAVARSWVTVRARPHRASRLLGSVGPDTRVELGETREGWQRIRLHGMSGWVEQGQFAVR